MECKQAKHFLLHQEHLSSPQKDTLQRHLTNCSSCQSFFHETKELEDLLSDYFSFPTLKQPLELLHTLPETERKHFQSSLAILVSVTFLLIFCSLILIPKHSRSTASESALKTEISSLPQAYIQTSSSLVPGGTGSIFLALGPSHENAPLPQLHAELVDEQENTVYTLLPSKSIQNHQNQYPFDIPSDLANGQYALKIVTVSADGDFARNYMATVQVVSPLKLFFQTDKPRYQPGQIIHLHSVLFPAQKQPLRLPENTPVRFQVYDPKGNLIFQEEVQPNTFGSAGCQFALADEISFGEYRLVAEYEHGKLSVEKEVLVDRYQLPKMRIQLDSPQQYYRPQDQIPIKIFARYPYGKVIPNASIELKFVDESGRYEYAHSSSNPVLKTDEKGQFETQITLTLPPTELKEPQKIYAVAYLTDEANQKESQIKTLFLASQPYQIHFIPEGGKLRLGLPNTLYCLATTPDGKPSPISLKFFDSYEEKKISVPEHGVAEITFTPNPQRVLKQEQNTFYPIEYQLQNEDSTKIAISIPVDTQKDQIYVTLDQAIYQPGSPFTAKIFGNNRGSSLFLTLSQGDIVLLQTTLNSPEEIGEPLSWESTMPLNATGTLSLTVAQLLSNGKWLQDQRTCFVRPNGTPIQITPKKTNSFRPGEPITLDFEIASPPDEHSQAIAENGSLAVFVVDETVFSFPAKNLAQLFYELEHQLRQHRASILSTESISASLQEEKIHEAQQKTAKAFYALQEEIPTFTELNVHYSQEDFERTQSILAKRLLPYLLDHDFLTGKNLKKIDPRLFERMVHDLKLPIDSPLLSPITLETLLNHHDVAPELKKISPEKISQTIETLRRESLLKEFGADISHPQILKKLEEQKRSKQRAYTPEGAPILIAPNQSDIQKNASRRDKMGTPKLEASPEPKEPLRNQKNQNFNEELSKSNLVEKTKTENKNTPGNGGGGVGDQTDSPIKKSVKQEDFVATEEESSSLLNGFLKKIFGSNESKPANSKDALRQEEVAEKETLELQKTSQESSDEDESFDPTPSLPKVSVKTEESLAGIGPEEDMDSGEEGKEKEEGESDQKSTPQESGRKGSKKELQEEVSSEIAQLIRFRKYFPETLWVDLFVPIHQGKGSITIPEAPDSITTFRVQTTFSSATGALGQGQAEFTVFQPFFVDLLLPTHFTVADEISLPIILHNHFAQSQNVEVLLRKADWFELSEEKTKNKIHETTTHYQIIQQVLSKKVMAVEVPIRILKAGDQKIEVEAKAIHGEGRDGILKKVLVLPEGQKQTAGQNFLLTKESTSLVWNRPHVPEMTNTSVALHVYPDLLSHLRNTSNTEMSYGGLEEVIHYGLPKLLLYKELQAQKRLTRQEEIEISYIFQRLLSYQNKGGFSRFPQGEPDVLLTALGLWMLYELRSFQNWKLELVDHCKKFLLDKRNSKGFYKGYISSFPFSQNDHALTSSIFWILRETGVPLAQIKTTQTYLKNHYNELNNPFFEALYYFSAKQQSDQERLLKLQGNTLEESLGISALRLMTLTEKYKEFDQDVLLLLNNKQSAQGWDSLFLDIFATNALLLAHQKSVESFQDVSLTIEETNYQLTPELTYQIPLTFSADKVSWKISTSSPLFCQLVTTYYTPWKANEETSESSLQVQYNPLKTPTSFPNWQAEVTFNAEKIKANTPVLLEIGIPPGFVPANLKELEVIGQIEHCEHKSRHILVYLKPLQEQKALIQFNIRLRPQFRLNARPPISQYREMAFQGKQEKSLTSKKVNTFASR